MVGLLSSVMDMPRAAFLFFLLVGAALMLEGSDSDRAGQIDGPAGSD